MLGSPHDGPGPEPHRGVGHGERCTISEIHGETTGLKSSQLKLLERLYRKRIPTHNVGTPELLRSMSEISRETGRQIGVLANRSGSVSHVIVGDAHGLRLPDFGRVRAGRDRFRGLRLLHTHLNGEGLTQDDMTDLALLRLDLCVMVQSLPSGLPGAGEYAYLLPPGPGADLWKVEPFKSVHDLDLDFQSFILSLEAEFSKATGNIESDGREKAILIGVAVKGRKGAGQDAPERLEELARLTESAGVRVLDRIIQYRPKIDPKYVMGRGKLEEVIIRSMQGGADMLIFDQDLRPSQLRSIAERTDLKVLDRSQLILDIFAQRATSKAGKLQVELAQLRYLMPRLNIMSTAMSRLSGGIGGRGPGETKLEIGRRRANERLTRLNRDLKQVSQQRAVRRQSRESAGIPVISLVGYTNAGKSTLLNRLTMSEVLAEDRLFATLDPVSRRLRFPEEREMILTDTVGFIRDLPKELIEAFKATLEELELADLLLHVVDASSSEAEAQIAAVNAILSQLGLDETPTLLVFNKIDAAPPEQVRSLVRRLGGRSVSAVTGEGCAALLGAIEAYVWRGSVGPEAESFLVEGEIETVVGADDLDLLN